MSRRQPDASGRDELSRLLIGLRGDRSQAEAARLARLSQSRVTRAERGRFPMQPDDAVAYAAALGATEDQLRRVKELAEAKTAEHVRGRVGLVRVAAALQERFAQLEADASLIRGWAPEGIHGVLQTPSYTATLLEGDGEGDPGPDWWAAREARADELRDADRSWHLLMSEAALRWPLGSREIMRDQLAHLAELSHLPNVRLGLLDLTTPKPFMPPVGFLIFDRMMVSTATELGTSFAAALDDVEHFERVFDQLEDAAVYGDEARELMRQIAEAEVQQDAAGKTSLGTESSTDPRV